MSVQLSEKERAWVSKSSLQANKSGWLYLTIAGEPFERGFQHGYQLADALAATLRSNRYWSHWLTAQDFSFFIDAANDMYLPLIDDEFKQEMEGIAAGAKAKGVDTSFGEILAWNSFVDLVYSWWPTEKAKIRPNQSSRHRDVGHRCSAFIATGSATSDGQIVMAHNTWDAFLQAQHFNVVIDISPSSGQRMVMQTAPGWIASMMDFTINSAGLMVTETTIDGYSGFDPTQSPEFYRSRLACQYSESIDQWADIMSTDRNGGYANSWLLGDTKTGEIARYELGLNYSSPLEKKTDGFFCGENVPADLKVRVMETADPSAYSDISGNGARRVRWKKLMNQHKGKIDVNLAKQMIGDHYDGYLEKDNPCSRTLCGHIDEDNGQIGSAHGHPPSYPWGAVDGKVADSKSVQEFGFHGRWGRACGQSFDAERFLKERPQYDWLDGYLISRPSNDWQRFGEVT